MFRTIVKVQVSLFPPGTEMLVYNRDKSYLYEGPLPADVKTQMGERPKAYFHALIHDGRLKLIGPEVPAQSW